jgi:preprotein translocase subunit YajC
MNFLLILAQETEKTPPSGLQQLLAGPIPMIVALFLMMYFLLIRPQKKQRKELAARVASIEKGDKVVTIGGLHSSVHHISDKTVTLKLAEGVFVPFEKSAIQTVIKAKKGGDSSDKSGKSESSGAADNQ